MTYAFTILGVPAPKGNSRRHICVRGKLVPLPSKKYAAWLSSSRPQINQAKAAQLLRAPIDVPVGVLAVFYRDARADVDNLCKALGDVLQACGVVKNDRLIRVWHATIATGRNRPRVELEITTLEGP